MGTLIGSGIISLLISYLLLVDAAHHVEATDDVVSLVLFLPHFNLYLFYKIHHKCTSPVEQSS